jgi:lipopolysaccharide biosynthesis protein
MGVTGENPSSEDLLDALRAENEALRLRIAELDAAAEEYRRQMSEVLTSSSWRATAKFRAIAGKVRLVRRRVRGIPRRILAPGSTSSKSTRGLFAPIHRSTTSGVLTSSPLLDKPLTYNQTVVWPQEEVVRTHAKVLVLAHVYYAEVWVDIEDRLARLPEDFDLIVTLVRGRAEGLEHRITRRLPHARIHLVDNRGRDSGPLVELARMRVFDGYDAVLKVHTKRSPHRLDGDAWRVRLLDGVLESPESVARIIELLRRDKNVGLVVPGGHIKGPETWGSDLELVEALAARFPFAFDPDSLRYPAGSMYWAKPWLLQRLADLGVDLEHFEPEADHLDGSTAHAIERFVGVLATAAGLEQVETDDVASRLHRARRSTPKPPRVLAFYLPQYHRSDANDEWWGPGFTDWQKVQESTPQYDGHRQPEIPGELGYYDLSDVHVMAAQGALAKQYGMSGFVMHHYWFDGRPLLDTPLMNLLNRPDIDFPFALSWANENWTRRWDGLDDDVLIAQTYPHGWSKSFYDDVLPALNDPRYIRVDDKPLLVIYRVGDIPDAREVIAEWKRRAAEDGLGGLHVLAVTPSRDFDPIPDDTLGALDGLVHFPPGSGVGLQSIKQMTTAARPGHTGDIFSFDAAADRADLRTTGPRGLHVHPGVMPGWDNTPRRGSASYSFHGGNPVTFRRWLARACAAASQSGPDTMVFVNAWNEWAEGAHLEPDARFGRGNLEAVRSVLEQKT